MTSQSHSSVVGQTVGVAHGPAHAAHVAPVAVPHAAPAVAVPAVATHAHAGHHAGHALGKREADADADADAQLVGPEYALSLQKLTHVVAQVGPANGHLVRASPVAVTHAEPLCHEVTMTPIWVIEIFFYDLDPLKVKLL